ncbi:hypothetical protein DPMN_019826 [Dreissena polymorpha]|uniref:Uncharacterized protein n=1 Tax=Dreissena polymorpha TaxID=45954 RepID=A0A9D4NK01_DREPO|nr:hypothetical protein DPMN_019826 [Dreissena polymorpha]
MHYSDRVESVPNRNSIDSDSERVSVVPGHVHGQPLMYLPAGTSVRSFPDQHPFCTTSNIGTFPDSATVGIEC